MIKKALQSGVDKDFIHEYILSVYGTNALRALCPNFCYTFAIYQSRQQIRLAMEKIPGPQIASHLYALMKQPFEPTKMLDFLKMWIQIPLALETAQQTLFFTHFDLHGENVLLRPCDPPLPYLQFLVLDKIFRLENVHTLTTLIDFGHATVRYEKGFIGQQNGFPQYGMYPFYVPGADLFKLVLYLWTNVFSSTTMTPHSMGERLKVFFEFIVDKFFGGAGLSKAVMQKTFYNGTELPCAFYSPYNFLQFMDQKSTEVQKILGIPRYPWTMDSISPKFGLYKNLVYQKKETYPCYQDLFCSSIQPMTKNLFVFSTPTSPTSPLTESEYQTIVSKTIPLLKRSELPAMDTFLQPHEVWKKFNAFVNFTLTEMREKRVPFSRDMALPLYFYRAHVCILGYKSYFSKT